mgnify:CR=1 FL=1
MIDISSKGDRRFDCVSRDVGLEWGYEQRQGEVEGKEGQNGRRSRNKGIKTGGASLLGRAQVKRG